MRSANSNPVYNDLVRPTRRNHALTVEMQVLIGLRFLACGSFQQVMEDVIDVDKFTVSWTVNSFCNAIQQKCPDFIRFPFRDDEKSVIKQGFLKLVGFLVQ